LARSVASCFSALAGLLLIGGAVAACGSSNNTGSGASATTGTASGGGGAGGSAGSAGIGGMAGAGGGIGNQCMPACTGTQICSVTHACIDAGTCAADGDCPMGEKCDTSTKKCVPGGGCGSKKLKADAVAPNLLIVLDRSCSMTQKVGATTKWNIAVQAIDTMTTTYAGKIRFGLTMFPDLVAPSCDQGAIPIPVAPDNEMAIQMLMNASLKAGDMYYPNNPCVTNIDTAMKQASTEPAFGDKTRDSYAILITDGEQSKSCDPNGTANATTTMIIKTMHDMQKVPTFVVGFGSGINVNQMNTFADAGGEASGGANKYYDASDQMSLDAALKAIAQKTFGCVFQLEETPPNPDEIYVFFDNKDPVSRDPTHMMGWDYDAAKNQVTFYGSSCSDLKSGKVGSVDIVFGCNMPAPG
jgi:hypothetical protein